MTTDAVSDISRRMCPLRVTEIDLAEQLPTLAVPPRDDDEQRLLWILVRSFTEPLGIVEVVVPEAGLAPTQIRNVVTNALSAPVAEAKGSTYLATREGLLRDAPTISVVVCTRDRAENLARCLEALSRCRYESFEIIVVDNAPQTTQAREVVERANCPVPLRRVVEPRPGLSWARNRGLAAATGEVVAYIDDDEMADVYWLAEIARGFSAASDVDCVTGPILPARLDGRPQRLFEAFGGHSKGRGFSRAIFDSSTRAVQDPLFPVPPFGAGGNMAFRRTRLEQLGAFDVALGAGTPSLGGEDTEMFSRLLLFGGRIVYEPGAFVWHHHHDSMDALKRQFVGYGTGLTAVYTALLLRRPTVAVGLLRLLPMAMRHIAIPADRREPSTEVVPLELLQTKRAAMLRGPAAYLRGRREANRRRRSTTS